MYLNYCAFMKNVLPIIPLCRWTALASASLIQENPDDLNVRPSDLHELLRACSCESALIQRELGDVRAQMLVLQQEGKNDMSDFAHGVKSGSSSVLRMLAAPWRQACEVPALEVVKVVQSMNP